MHLYSVTKEHCLDYQSKLKSSFSDLESYALSLGHTYIYLQEKCPSESTCLAEI